MITAAQDGIKFWINDLLNFFKFIFAAWLLQNFLKLMLRRLLRCYACPLLRHYRLVLFQSVL